MKAKPSSKKLKEEEGVISTTDPRQAEKLAKKGLTVKLTTEEDSNLSEKDIHSVAEEVSRTLTDTLESLGDEVLKTSILVDDVNFHLKVQFSDDREDTFEFFVDDDMIYYNGRRDDVELVDFSITPGGKVYLNSTLLSDKLEEMLKLDTVSEASNIMKNEQDETEDRAELKVGSYQTHYYDICPGASVLYRDIESKVDDMDLAERSAKLQDILFFIEKHVQQEDYDPDPYYAVAARTLADQIMKMAEMMGLESEHDYIESHVDDIKQAVGIENIDESTDSKIFKEAFTKIFKEFRDSLKKLVREDFDLGHIDDEVDMLKQEAYEMAIYAGKLYKMLHTLEPYGSEIDFPHWWQGKIIKARDYLGKAVHYLEFELEQPSLDRHMDQHNSMHLQEQKATCCGRCGRVHVKGTECKKPYLSKSSSRHCQN